MVTNLTKFLDDHPLNNKYTWESPGRQPQTTHHPCATWPRRGGIVHTKITRENDITDTDNRARKSMKLNNTPKECFGNKHGRVGGWPRAIKWAYLENRSTTISATDLPPTFENPSTKSMYQLVNPHNWGCWQGLQKTNWMDVYRLISLANNTYLNKLPNLLISIWAVEGSLPVPHEHQLATVATWMRHPEQRPFAVQQQPIWLRPSFPGRPHS